ncbi:MAG: tetratricopeptide repeat protein [Prevotella sp.]|jgi:YesN/AraC family two-component response regulator
MKRSISLFLILLLFLPAYCKQEIGGKNQGYSAYAYGRAPEAKPDYAYLFKLYQQGRTDSYISRSLLWCGNNYYLEGKYAEAIEVYTLGIQVAEKAGDHDAMCLYSYGIANIYVIFRDYRRAIEYYQKAIEKCSNKNVNTKALCYVYLTVCYCRLGDLKSARYYMNLVKTHPVDDKKIADYYSNYNQGLIASLTGNYSIALQLLKKALRITSEAHLMAGMGATAANDLGYVFSQLHQSDSAIVYYKMGYELGQKDHAVDEVSRSCVALTDLYKKRNGADSSSLYLNLNQQLLTGSLNPQRFFNSQAKLRDYENNVVESRIGNLKGYISWLMVVVVVIIAFMLLGLYYNSKLRKTYRLLVKKNHELIEQKEENMKLEEENKQLKSNFVLSEEQKAKLSKDILQVFKDPEIICKPDFSLNKLATIIGSNAKYVSTVINEEFGKNFKSMLNEYRIEIASKRLSDPAYNQYTIEAIAKSVGYSSINNFINVFKKVIGVPPSVYKKLAVED